MTLVSDDTYGDDEDDEDDENYEDEYQVISRDKSYLVMKVIF